MNYLKYLKTFSEQVTQNLKAPAWDYRYQSELFLLTAAVYGQKAHVPIQVQEADSVFHFREQNKPVAG
jgi:hypothetical protein